MKSGEIRKRFLEFFEKRGHKVVPSSSLIPDGDASVLFTTAGMQQFKSYYTAPLNATRDFGSLNTATIQKCVRTSDIDEVGDATHLTFFEMLGNFSFGGYGKEDAIIYAHDFITKELGLEISYITFFKGVGSVGRDDESEKVWEKLGIKDIREDGPDVFWGPTGNSGPCGPTTEIYCKNTDGQDVEIWNIVFNQYFCEGSREELDKGSAGKAILKDIPLGIDTGMGLERLAMISQEVPTIFETDLFAPIMESIKGVSGGDFDTKVARIVADHIRTAVFMIADGVTPSNTERGYILRRLIRRVTKSEGSQTKVAEAVIENYKEDYPELKNKKATILNEIKMEEEKFAKNLTAGLKYFERGEDPFVLHTTYGFPIDLTKELAKEKGIQIDEKDFEEKFKKHQEISKAGMEQKFKGGLGGHSEMEVKYHTATHLLHQALREVLGEHVEQKGSNITPERLRFDFMHSQKMIDEEKKKVEDIVNKKISENLSVNNIILPRAEAEKSGALHFFGEKYGNEISIYFVGPTLETAYSKEFCGGPHVSNIGELGHFKITKEEAVAAGIRRIKAILE